jgi:hypothetical protein
MQISGEKGLQSERIASVNAPMWCLERQSKWSSIGKGYVKRSQEAIVKPVLRHIHS